MKEKIYTYIKNVSRLNTTLTICIVLFDLFYLLQVQAGTTITIITY